jgi:hypothetical protein
MWWSVAGLLGLAKAEKLELVIGAELAIGAA